MRYEICEREGLQQTSYAIVDTERSMRTLFYIGSNGLDYAFTSRFTSVWYGYTGGIIGEKWSKIAEAETLEELKYNNPWLFI